MNAKTWKPGDLRGESFFTYLALPGTITKYKKMPDYWHSDLFLLNISADSLLPAVIGGYLLQEPALQIISYIFVFSEGYQRYLALGLTSLVSECVHACVRAYLFFRDVSLSKRPSLYLPDSLLQERLLWHYDKIKTSSTMKTTTKMKTFSKMKMTSKMKKTSIMRTTSKNKTS